MASSSLSEDATTKCQALCWVGLDPLFSENGHQMTHDE